jgi:hypothetical protein
VFISFYGFSPYALQRVLRRVKYWFSVPPRLLGAQPRTPNLGGSGYRLQGHPAYGVSY